MTRNRSRNVLLAVMLVPVLLAAGEREAEVVQLPGSDTAVTAKVLPDVRSAWFAGVPDSVRQGLAEEPEEWLDDLVLSLTGELLDEQDRVRAIHDWVALSIAYDTSLLRAETIPGQRCEDVLRTGRTVCGGYSNLFERMCRLAGIECVTIPGYARGERFRVLDEEDPTLQDHAWNAVRLGDTWRLLDVTWDAGRVMDGEYEQQYSSDYLLVPPGRLIHTHFPSDPRWQLLEPPLSAAEFSRLPYLRAEFFRYGLELLTPLERVNRAGPQVSFELLVPMDVSVFARLLDPERRKQGPETRPEVSGGRSRFSFSLPDTGAWLVSVYAKRGPPGGSYNGVARFGFVRGD